MLISNNNSKTNSRITNGWELTRASVDGLVKAIESGCNEVFSSYLQTMAHQEKLFCAVISLFIFAIHFFIIKLKYY